MWLFLAVSAAVLWGLHYSVEEKLLRVVPPSTVCFYTSVLLMISTFIFFRVLGEPLDIRPLFTRQAGWLFVVSESATTIANIAILYSIAFGNNASSSSLIEISYPLWVILFTMLLFGEFKLTPLGIAGGVLIGAGTVCVIYSNVRT